MNASRALEVADMVDAPLLRERALAIFLEDPETAANTRAGQRLQKDHPELMNTIVKRLSHRNRTVGTFVALAQQAAQDAEKDDAFGAGETIPWWQLIGGLLLMAAYSVFAKYNTSDGVVVPFVNVVTVIAGVTWGIYSLRK